MSDMHQVKAIIQKQQKKTGSAMKDATVELATSSKYNSLKRPERRNAEHHYDMMTAERSLQKDIRSAEKMARRIAQVLDQLRKDVNKIKNLLGNYGFANTVGVDSTASGACENDLSADIRTREAWKQELINLITMVYHYVEAQKLGDYAILHSVSTTSDCTPCCPVKYRSEFHYSTPRGDCLAFASSMGEAYTATTDNPTPPKDAKYTPAVYEHQSVKNEDLKFALTYKLIVSGDGNEWETIITEEFKAAVDSIPDQEATSDYDSATSAFTTATKRKELIKNYLMNTSCLPGALADALLASVVETAPIPDTADPADITEAKKHVPMVANVEDESDLTFISKHFTEKMKSIRDCQVQNDREQQRMDFVRETSECNEAFHQDAFNDLTKIDEHSVRAKLNVGKQLSHDLNDLYVENCFNKQVFFNDITLDGCEW